MTPFNEQAWLTWLVKARVVVITSVLGMELAFENFRPSAVAKGPFITVVVVWYAVAAFFALLLHVWDDHFVQARLQVLTDLVFATSVIYVTGGMDTLFNFLPPLIIIVAAIMLPRSWAFLTAALSFILFGAALELSYFGLIRSYSVTRSNLTSLQAMVLVNLIAYLAIAYLASKLVIKLRRVNVELAEASGALEDLQTLHQHIIFSMSSGLISTDRSGRVCVVNPAGAGLLGRAQEQILGMPLNLLLGEGTPPVGGKRCELRYRPPGSEVSAEKVFGMGVSELRASDGSVQGQLYTFTDLTEIRRLERELQMRDRMAAVGRLASGIAHEIRNPLTAIAGSAQMLRESSGLGADEQSLLDIVRRESERLNKIVTDFLSYSRDQQCRLSAQNLVPLLEETLRLLENRPECSTGAVRIERDIPPDELLAMIDGDRARQVFWNVSDNAFRAMPEGGSLTVSLSGDANAVYVRFTDTGIGMDQRQLDAIFEPFHSKFAKGTGLGLAFVYQIMRAHQGGVTVQSAPGKGSTFTLHFKRAAQVEAARGASAGGPDRG